jgi:hypothetical protein
MKSCFPGQEIVENNPQKSSNQVFWSQLQKSDIEDFVNLKYERKHGPKGEGGFRS